MSVAVLAAYRDIVDDLVAAGVPGFTHYWTEGATAFYLHPSAKLKIDMVGRGGDKSRESVAEGIAETTAGEHRVPPGERHYFIHVSENRDEAAKTLGVYEQYLRLLKIPFHRSGDSIDLDATPRGVKVLACRVGAVSGWRCIGWTADECAKWEVGSSRVDLQACKLEYSIVSPK